MTPRIQSLRHKIRPSHYNLKTIQENQSVSASNFKHGRWLAWSSLEKMSNDPLKKKRKKERGEREYNDLRVLREKILEQWRLDGGT